jgi:hypothetical protein
MHPKSVFVGSFDKTSVHHSTRSEVVRMKVFVSYSSQNRPAVKSLVADLVSLEHEVWFDQELSGGQVWWDTILDQIRACELFVFALTRLSIKSEPCRLEYTYAYELNKPIIPVLLTNDVNITLLPVILQERQFVNYINQDKAALLALNNAIHNTPPARRLPDPLPTPPGIPISPLAALQAEIEKTSLPYESQIALFHRIKDYIDDPQYHNDALVLMKELEQHPSLLAAVFKEINTYLSEIEPDRAPQPPSLAQPGRVEGVPPREKAASTGLAHIQIRRPDAWSARLREYPIYIDDQKMGSVRNNQEIILDIAPGTHVIYAKLDWLTSERHTIMLQPGETVCFLCRWDVGALAGITGGKMVLEREG